MPQPLFRPEVLQARRQSWLGPVVLGTPPGLRLLLALLAMVLATAVLFLLQADYSRRTRAAGLLVPDLGLVTLLAPAAGLVDAVPVEEGGAVLAGGLLVRLAVPAASDLAGDALAAADAALVARREAGLEQHRAQAALLDVRLAAARAQRDLLHEEQARLTDELAARRRQRGLAAAALARLHSLQARRFASEAQVAQQAADLQALDAGLRALERQQAALRRQQLEFTQRLDEGPAERRRLEAQARREDESLAQERRELHARHAARVLAPVHGRVAPRYVEPGAQVRAGEPLLALVPAGSVLQAHLRLPGAAIGRLQPGDPVRLRLSAFPFQSHGHHAGRVERISRSAVAREDGGEPEYRVVVALARQSVQVDGRELALSPGMAVDAEILGERRSLAAWLLAPLRAMRARTSRGEP